MASSDVPATLSSCLYAALIGVINYKHAEVIQDHINTSLELRI